MWNKSPYLRFINRCLTSYRNYGFRGARETHYDVLNLPRNCSSKDIKDAFIKLSKQYHPDKNSSKESQDKFVKISNAYTVLSKPDSRRSYDLGLPLSQSHFNETQRFYHEVPLEKDPWDDPFFYKNRDKTKDSYYARQPYYGIKGVAKIPNRVIALLCFLVAGVGIFLQIIAVRRDEMIRRSNELAKELQMVRNKATVNGHDLQVQLLEERFRKEGLLKEEKSD